MHRGFRQRGLDLQLPLGRQQFIGFLRLDHGLLGLHPGQFIGPLGLDDGALGLDLLLVQLGQHGLLSGLFLNAALRDADFALLALLLGLSLGLHPQQVLVGLLGLEPLAHDLVEPGLDVGRQEHFGHDHVVHAQAEVGGQFVEFVVDAVAQFIACGADDRVVEVAVTHADLHGLLRAQADAGAHGLVIGIELVVLGPQLLNRVFLRQSRPEDIAGDHQPDALLVLGDQLGIGDLEGHGPAGDALEVHEEAHVVIDAGADNVGDAAAFKLDRDLVFIDPLEEVKELACEAEEQDRGAEDQQADDNRAEGNLGSAHRQLLWLVEDGVNLGRRTRLL